MMYNTYLDEEIRYAIKYLTPDFAINILKSQFFCFYFNHWNLLILMRKKMCACVYLHDIGKGITRNGGYSILQKFVNMCRMYDFKHISKIQNTATLPNFKILFISSQEGLLRLFFII